MNIQFPKVPKLHAKSGQSPEIQAKAEKVVERVLSHSSDAVTLASSDNQDGDRLLQPGVMMRTDYSREDNGNRAREIVVFDPQAKVINEFALQEKSGDSVGFGGAQDNGKFEFEIVEGGQRETVIMDSKGQLVQFKTSEVLWSV